MQETRGIRVALSPRLFLVLLIGWGFSGAASAALHGTASPVPAFFALAPRGPPLRQSPPNHQTLRPAAASPAAAPTERTAGVPLGTTEALECVDARSLYT